MVAGNRPVGADRPSVQSQFHIPSPCDLVSLSPHCVSCEVNEITVKHLAQSLAPRKEARNQWLVDE